MAADVYYANLGIVDFFGGFGLSSVSVINDIVH